ncbi:MAG: DNA-deoxyinosine glycosylase, partial [Spirochaetales bacterium]|nr:DNA-deoxyinosine glycosylase [Spirochaetales bacterium]
NYSERIKFLISNRIALWDVLQSCEREGSLDKDIRSEKPNNIPELLNRHPSINRIFCNGQGSRRLLKKFYPELFTAYDVTVLPSTSPAYTARYEEKLETWKLLMNDTAP